MTLPPFSSSSSTTCWSAGKDPTASSSTSRRSTPLRRGLRWTWMEEPQMDDRRVLQEARRLAASPTRCA